MSDRRISLSASGLGGGNLLFPHGSLRAYVGDQTLQLEWHLGLKAGFCGVTLRFNAVEGCGGIQLFVGFPWLFNLWFTVERVPKWILPWHWAESYLRPGEMWKYPEQRWVALRIFDSRVWFSLWENEMERSHLDPWWQHFTISPLDILLGETRYFAVPLMGGRCVVPMPEHGYPASYKLFRSTWKRPRWPWAQSVIRVEIENDDPIPLPGKGENAWDCDDDACNAITMPCPGTVAEAARAYAESIVRDRVKRCGREVYP